MQLFFPSTHTHTHTHAHMTHHTAYRRFSVVDPGQTIIQSSGGPRAVQYIGAASSHDLSVSFKSQSPSLMLIVASGEVDAWSSTEPAAGKYAESSNNRRTRRGWLFGVREMHRETWRIKSALHPRAHAVFLGSHLKHKTRAETHCHGIAYTMVMISHIACRAVVCVCVCARAMQNELW